MRHPTLRSHFLLITLFTLLAACGDGGYTPATPDTGSRGELVSANTKSAYTAITLQSQSTTYPGFDTHSASMTHDVNTYKITYWTIDTADNPIKVSGLLAIPANHDTSLTKLVSYHHGTIFYTADAPSNSLLFDVLAAMLASMDHIVVMPDYIGYGESVALLHPYMHATSLAHSSIDMLRAAKSFMNSNNIAFSNQVLLGGYSEGGYTAVATHKIMQENHASEFNIVATYAGAGTYDMLETANTLLAADMLPYAPYVAFVFKAYDEVYSFNRISEIFNSDYVDTINNDFYGTVNGNIIMSRLTNQTATLFTQTFLNGFRSDEEAEIKTRLTENNIYNWTPQVPLQLYHGQDDITVPYANAQTALDTMTKNGATDVAITNCDLTPGSATHSNCYFPYLVSMATFFLSK